MSGKSTGATFGYEELDTLRTSPDHLLLIAELEDPFGSYGKIGLAVVEKAKPCWRLRLLLMSCRVVSRGVGTVLLNHVMTSAYAGNLDFCHTMFLSWCSGSGRGRVHASAPR